MQINDEMVRLAQNAMIVAGMEMGAEGDHWPVIKANIKVLLQDYADLQTEYAVQEQLEEHIGAIIVRYEQFLVNCQDIALRDKIAPQIGKLREIHDAMFTPLAENLVSAKQPDESEAAATSGGYVPWRSSAAIIATLTESQ